jgi:hypothetical protein
LGLHRGGHGLSGGGEGGENAVSGLCLHGPPLGLDRLLEDAEVPGEVFRHLLGIGLPASGAPLDVSEKEGELDWS